MKAESKQKGNLRFYPCPRCGNSHASITTLLGVINSPALNGWLAKNGTAKLNVYDSVVKEWSVAKPEIHSALRKIAEQRWKLTEDTAFWKSGKESGAEAADIGTIAHAWLESHLNGVQIDLGALPPLAKNAVGSYLAWEREHKIETIKTEQTFYNCKLGYAGTADWVGMLENELSIADWKTATGIYFNHIIQGWGYALADEMQNSERLYRQIVIGRFGKDGVSEVKIFKRNEFPSIETAREVITACGQIFAATQEYDRLHPYKPKEKLINASTH